MNRRHFLWGLGLAGAGGSVAGDAIAAVVAQSAAGAADDVPTGIEWTIYARHLQWLTTREFAASNPYDTGVLIGEKAREIGFRHVDLTVRRDGHVDPELADVGTNLPRLLEGLRSTGADCREMTTSIVAVDRPVGAFEGRELYPAELLKIAGDNGIRYYKWGSFNYDIRPDPDTGRPGPFGDEVVAQLDAFADVVGKIADLSRQHRMTALYHTYSGRNGLRSVWDLVYIHRRFSPEDVAFNFDIGHMSREGALSAWNSNMRYAMPWIRAVSLKDGMVRRGDDGQVDGAFVAAGTGLVQWDAFFRLLLEGRFNGPAEAQYEYEVTGSNGQPVSLNNAFWADDEQFRSRNLTASFMTAELQNDFRFYKDAALRAGWNPSQFA